MSGCVMGISPKRRDLKLKDSTLQGEQFIRDLEMGSIIEKSASIAGSTISRVALGGDIRVSPDDDPFRSRWIDQCAKKARSH